MSVTARLMCWALKAGATPLRTAFQCLSVWPVSMFVPIRNCNHRLRSANTSRRKRKHGAYQHHSLRLQCSGQFLSDIALPQVLVCESMTGMDAE